MIWNFYTTDFGKFSDGVADGCSVAILQASDMGRPVYERMGFRTVVEYLGFVDPPGPRR